MSEWIENKKLFSCETLYLKNLFETFVYPWEILPNIKNFIAEILKTGIEGYEQFSEGVLVGENVKIHPSAVIEGTAVIGDGTTLRPGAFLRGNVVLGKDCVVGNSTELKNCILLDKVQVPHYNYVGDSILGNRSHLGAGVICSNLKSDGKNVVIHSNENYATNLRKVGAFIGDGAEIGCGCVLNPGTIIGKNTSVYPLLSLRGVFPSESIVKNADSIIKRI